MSDAEKLAAIRAALALLDGSCAQRQAVLDRITEIIG